MACSSMCRPPQAGAISAGVFRSPPILSESHDMIAIESREGKCCEASGAEREIALILQL